MKNYGRESVNGACLPCRPPGVRQYPGALKGCGVKRSIYLQGSPFPTAWRPAATKITGKWICANFSSLSYISRSKNCKILEIGQVKILRKGESWWGKYSKNGKILEIRQVKILRKGESSWGKYYLVWRHRSMSRISGLIPLTLRNTKWLPLCRQHFQIHFLEWMQISLKFVPMGSIDNTSALVQIMAWHQTGAKPLSEPTRMPVFWWYHLPPNDYPYYWIILDPKSKENKVKVTKEFAKISIYLI